MDAEVEPRQLARPTHVFLVGVDICGIEKQNSRICSEQPYMKGFSESVRWFIAFGQRDCRWFVRGFVAVELCLPRRGIVCVYSLFPRFYNTLASFHSKSSPFVNLL